MSEPLSGTQSFRSGDISWNHSFSDNYAKQWNDTLQWMKGALHQRAQQRNAEREYALEWLDERRDILRDLIGISKFEAVTENIRFFSGNDDQVLYQIQLANGLVWSGAYYTASHAVPEGVVLLVESGAVGVSSSVQHYLDRGWLVIQPFLTRERRSYHDDPLRKHYMYDDHELIHFFSFICGASLTGLEALELITAGECLMKALGMLPGEVPLFIDARGRYALTGVVVSALYSEKVAAIRLDSSIDRLNRQELDVRCNTIWAFHKYFDALTLFQLAEKSDLLFVEHGATISECAAQTMQWFSDHKEMTNTSRKIIRVLPEQAEEIALQWAKLLKSDCSKGEVMADRPTSAAEHGNLHIPPCIQGAITEESLYMHSLESKLVYIQQLHDQAEGIRKQRFETFKYSDGEHATHIRNGLLTVMGESLPRTQQPRVRTRAVLDHASGRLNLNAYGLYEVLLESVPGVTTAGYLLIPHGAGPFPAVICQHGLTGRPEDLLGLTNQHIYYRFAHSLAEKGFVTYVPFMNWGWGGLPGRDQLAKHAYALGITPNQFEVSQLACIVDFLQSRPEVKSDGIGFYGLSYGGHASLWLGACEPRLAAVVTAGHFNNWCKKLTSTDVLPPCTRPCSYISVSEGMDMFTYNVLNHLGHAEMASLHAPRPYMVENGLQDSVTPTQWVDEEFALVRRVYEAYGAEEHADLVHFGGGHRIWGEESFPYLRKHLG